jgi:hypothetical protein
MQEHRNDEISSHMWRGPMVHKDEPSLTTAWFHSP